MWVGWRWKERKKVGFSLGVGIWGREGKEEDLEGVIPQGLSGNSIDFWFSSQRKLNFAMSEKLFCKIIYGLLLTSVDSRLCCCQTCNRYTEWRTGYIVQTNLMAEFYRSRVAAMFATDSYMKFWTYWFS